MSNIKAVTQNTEPTAGEWAVIDEPEIFGDNGRLSIKYGYYYLASILTSDAVNLKEAKANAHCMAASRDMQKALELASEILWNNGLNESARIVDAALEKSKVKP